MAAQRREAHVGGVVLLFRKMTPEEERRRDDDALWAQVPAHLREGLEEVAPEFRWDRLVGRLLDPLFGLPPASLVDLAQRIEGLSRCPHRDSQG